MKKLRRITDAVRLGATALVIAIGLVVDAVKR